MKKRHAVAVAMMLAVSIGGCATRSLEEPDACAIAQRYMEAGNSSDASLVADLLADDVSAVFLAEDNEEHSVLQGKAAIIEAVETYTAQCPSCRSSLRCLFADEAAVYVIEDVAFVDQDGIEQQQSAPLIFELENGQIVRIVYYPATR